MADPNLQSDSQTAKLAEDLTRLSREAFDMEKVLRGARATIKSILWEDMIADLPNDAAAMEKHNRADDMLEALLLMIDQFLERIEPESPGSALSDLAGAAADGRLVRYFAKPNLQPAA